MKDSRRKARIAFALDENGGSRTDLRASRPTGRRFELARLLADRLLFDEDDRLHPATPAYTYRQKMRRAFAGELLCPIDSLTGYMAGDYSDDAKEDAADRLRVSPLAVTTLLVSNDLVDRREMHPVGLITHGRAADFISRPGDEYRSFRRRWPYHDRAQGSGSSQGLPPARARRSGHQR